MKMKKVLALGLATLTISSITTPIFALTREITTKNSSSTKNSNITLNQFNNFTQKQLNDLENGKTIHLTPEQIKIYIGSNMRTNTEHSMLIKNGAILEDVSITPYVVTDETYYGKDYIVTNKYKQPKKVEREYVEDWWNTATDTSAPIEFTIGQIMDAILPQALLYPLSFFGIGVDINDMADYYSSGWVELANETNYYIKTAYVYDSERDRHFSGASARGSYISLFGETRWQEDGYTKRSTSNEYLKYLSKNFILNGEAGEATKDKELIRLAKIYYKDDFYNEYPNYPSKVNLR